MGNLPSIWHPRVVHTLLGYTPDTTSFIKRAPAVHWVGGDPPDWPIQYKLFKKFKILNDRVLRKNSLRVVRRAVGKDSSDSEGGSKKSRRKKKEAPAVTIVGGYTCRPTGVSILEPLAD